MAMTVNDTAIANATMVRELLDEVDTFLDWERDPLRYLFATVCTVSALMWFGFAGDNLQYYRMNGGLAYAGGATFRSVWAESFSRSGSVLLVFRAAALATCAYYEWSQKSYPRLTLDEETGMYGLDTAQFLNLHDWVTHAVTGFFFLATLASIVGVFSRTQTHDHYLGHSGRCNTLGHWVMSSYTVAFTMSVVFLVTVVVEAVFTPQCGPSSDRGKMATLFDPGVRLCYFEPKYMLGYVGAVVLMLMEASLGRLVFPKSYMSQPIFVCSFFFIFGQFNVMVLGGEWAYQWTNYLRKETMFYLNAFMCLTMYTHLGLVKFLHSGEVTNKHAEERVPLFM